VSKVLYMRCRVRYIVCVSKKPSVAEQYESLVAELDELAKTVDTDACEQNLYDKGITVAWDADDAEKLAYARQLRDMIFWCYGV
jgi:hypothetical protein